MFSYWMPANYAVIKRHITVYKAARVIIVVSAYARLHQELSGCIIGSLAESMREVYCC
jgi:hypothetical protein